MNKYNRISVNGKSKDEHRHLVEQHLGRKLGRNEVVHHIDGDKFNNDLSNLEVMTREAHSRLHAPKQQSPQRIFKLRDTMKRRPSNHKLTKNEVLAARLLHDDGYPVTCIAEFFKVDRKTISRAVNGRTWKLI